MPDQTAAAPAPAAKPPGRRSPRPRAGRAGLIVLVLLVCGLATVGALARRALRSTLGADGTAPPQSAADVLQTVLNPSRGGGGTQPGPALAPDVLFARASPSVVQVVVQDRQGRDVGSGSGFLVDPKGLFVTNYHVIKNAHTFRLVTSANKQIVGGGVVAEDREADLAVLAVPEQEVAGLTPLELSAGELPAVGTKVYAIGSPLGLANTLSDGLVSGHRELDRFRAIQISAPISPGSSGGPLLGPDGRVVGVTTAGIRNGQNLNFAVSSRFVLPLVLKAGLGSPSAPRPVHVPASGDFLPTRVGTTWLYHTKDGLMVTMIVAADADPRGKRVSLESSIDGRVVSSERILVAADGAYRDRYQAAVIDPPIRYLKLPAAEGETWRAAARVGGQPFDVLFSTGKMEDVVVSGGTFQALRVDGEGTFGKEPSTVTMWFVPRVGLVKMQTETGGQQGFRELAAFSPGNE